MYDILKILIMASVFFISIISFMYINNYINKVKKKAQKERKISEKDESFSFWLFNKIRREPSSKTAILSKIISGILTGILVYILTGEIYWTILFGIIGVFIPKIIADKKNKNFMNKFNNQLIDGLELMTNSLRAGTSFPQALEMMVENIDKPLSKIFGETLRDFKLGIPMNEALENTTEKVQSQELKMAVIAINISRETGGNLGEILDQIATIIRDRNKLRGKVESLTSQGKMSGVIIASAPFLLLMILNLLNPSLMGFMFNTTLGYIILTVIIFMVAIGWIFMSKIINIEV